MTILTNNEDKRTIKISLSDIIHEDQKEYTAVLPFIVCSNKQDAVYIQEKVNSYVNKISKELLK